VKNSARRFRWLQGPCLIFIVCLVSITTSPADAQVTQKIKSPDGKYSVEVVRGRPSEDSLVISKGEEVIAKVPTPVGPEGSFFQTLWSPDGRYVAINKQRSSRSGGDEMWIVALPSGKVLSQPDDALWNELEKRADACIDEKHLSEAGGKVFLTLTATGWREGRLRFRLDVWLSEIETHCFVDGTVEPLNLRMINDWKVSTANPTSSGNGDKPSDSAIEQKLLGYWKSPSQVYHIIADGKMYVGRRKDVTTERWNVKDGKFYWWSVPYTIVTLTDEEFVFREIGGIGGQEETFTLIRSTKEEVDPE